MHAYRTYQLHNTYITGLKPNYITARVTLTDNVDIVDSACKKSTYSDPHDMWTDVVVLGSIKITLQDYIADVRINTNRVLFRSGVVCELNATRCADIEGGDSF
ncbi:hypothetical protein P5V15_001302 [Pogonomyrmex californicus]